MSPFTKSTCDDTLSSPIQSFYDSSPDAPEPARIQRLLSILDLQKHPEGGYFVETDRDPLRVPNPFQQHTNGAAIPQPASAHGAQDDDSTRSASTTIYYLLTPGNPKGAFHRNKGRTIHTLHEGRGRYVVIHADEQREGQKARIETFVVGQNVDQGEKLQWVVEGGKYKASFLLPDTEHGISEQGLLISEVIKSLYYLFDPRSFVVIVSAYSRPFQTVVPGFEFHDHDFMSPEVLHDLVSAEQSNELRWLLRTRDQRTEL